MPRSKMILTDLEKFCIDAYVQNGNADLAYILSRTHKPTATPISLHRQALEWIKTERVQEYLKYRVTHSVIAVAEEKYNPINFRNYHLACGRCPFWMAWAPELATPESDYKELFGDDYNKPLTTEEFKETRFCDLKRFKKLFGKLSQLTK